MATLSQFTLPEMTNLVSLIWKKTQDSIASEKHFQNSGLVRIETAPLNTGSSRAYTEINLEQYASDKAEGDVAKQARFQTGYEKTLILKRISLEMPVTVEMRKWNKYSDVYSYLTNLMETAGNRIELDLSQRLTFGWATSYVNKDGNVVDVTVGDGLALFSTVHTLKGTTLTYSNVVPLNPVLSRSSLEAAEDLVTDQTLNQFGEKMSLKFDILATTDDASTVNVARELLQSTAAVSPVPQSGGLSQNAGVVNVYQGKYRHVILPLVATNPNGSVDSTKKKYWFLASSKGSQMHMLVSEYPFVNNPAIGNNAEDVDTEDWVYRVSASYGIATVSANWIKGSRGDGAA